MVVRSHLHLILAGIDERWGRGGVRSANGANDAIWRSQGSIGAAQSFHARHGHEGHMMTR